MTATLNKGSKLTGTHISGRFWEIDDTFIFESSYINGKNLFFLKNHELSSLGFSEDIFQIINN
jgi:hypothetical protein